MTADQGAEIIALLKVIMVLLAPVGGLALGMAVAAIRGVWNKD